MLERHTSSNTTYWKTPSSPKHTQTVIMIHGFRGTHHGLLKISEQLPDNLEVIVPDLPGFGETPPLTSHTLDDFTTWLQTFITELSLTKPPVLAGHSFGSIVAASFASAFPTVISKLVLINPIGAPALEGPKAVMTKLAILYYKVGEKLPSKAAHYWLGAKPIVRVMSVTMAKTNDKELRRSIHAQHDMHFSTFHSAKTVLEAFTTSTKHNVREMAKNINVPTLLIVADKDDITPLKKQYELLKLLPHAQLKVISNVGHLTHYETPAEVASYIYDFIRSE